MSFLLSFFSILSYTSIYAEWINDHLIIPLGEDIQEYVNIPEAILYVDGEIVEDANCYYRRDGVDRTFISVVNTNIVKTYEIRYEVTYPDFHLTSVHTIKFQVVDQIAPEFIQIPNFRITLDDLIPDLLEGLTYQDNYDEFSLIKVSVHQSNIILGKIGRYVITYFLTDQSGNRSVAASYLEIYDHLPPEIMLKKEIVLSVGTMFSYMNFLEIKDNYDLILDIEIDQSLLNVFQIGEYYILVKVSDQSGNQTSAQFKVKVIDDIPPELILKSSPKPIPVYQEIMESDLLDYILEVSDNVDDKENLIIQILHNIDTERIGNYEIYFRVTDLSHNMIERKMVVFVVDEEPPIISLLEPLIFDVYDTSPHLNSIIELSDNYYDSSELTMKITTSFKMDVVGDYPIVVESKDPSGNVCYLRDYIHIVDRIPPTIEQISEILITDFKPRIYNSYFNYFDQYDLKADITLEINEELVDYLHVGTYPIFIYAKDKSDNQAFLETYVIIADIIEPILRVNQDLLIIEVGSIIPDLRSLIIEVSDNYDNLDQEDVLISGNININQVGIYTIYMMLVDSSSNRKTIELIIKVEDYEKPQVSGNPISVLMGDHIDVMDGIVIQDNTDQYDVLVFPYQVDTSYPGSQTIRYIITDQRGNTTIFDREVYIQMVEEKTEIKDLTSIIMIGGLGIALCFYIYKKR